MLYQGRPIVIRRIAGETRTDVVHVRFTDVPQYIPYPGIAGCEMPNPASLATVPATAVQQS